MMKTITLTGMKSLPELLVELSAMALSIGLTPMLRHFLVFKVWHGADGWNGNVSLKRTEEVI